MADVGNKRFCLFLLLVVQSLPKNAAVLPARAGLIEQYFNLGLNYSEILLFLGLSHGCFLSIQQLKRILKYLGLGRRNRSNPQIICEAIEEELHGSGSMLGYRQMARRLLHEYGVSTDKETVRQLLKMMDPQGASQDLNIGYEEDNTEQSVQIICGIWTATTNSSHMDFAFMELSTAIVDV